MSRRTALSVLFWSITVGGLVAILTGNNRAVSLRIWLAAFAIWFALAVLKRLFIDAPLFPSLMVAMLSRNREIKVSRTEQIREVRALQGLLLRSRDNDRAFTQQLRPRLVALADHYLLLNHGIDMSVEPDRAAQTLGELVWLTDDRVQGRAPTLQEVDSLVQILTSSTHPNAEEAA